MIPTRLLAASAAAVVALAAPSAATGQDAMTILQGASSRYAGVSALCADFEQTLTVPLLHQEQTGKGRLCQAAPDRFAMRFSEPDGDVVVVDGTYVWVYYKSQDPGTVLRFSVGAAPGRFDLHKQFLERPAEKYRATLDGSEKVEGHEAYRIRLVPREATSFKSAVVWIDKGDQLLRKARVEEENESVRTVTLSHIDPSADPPADWFTFTPPPGTQVIAR